ncbi:MAG: zf-TFIIB domain-containing protein [Verrucomicrobiota bacterium]
MCPKCREEMRPNQYKGVEYEQCKNCGGLWFDALEAEELVEVKDAAQIDTGDAKTGKKMNKKWEVTCPKCSTPMMPVHDVEQPHIQLESCPDCHGTFFDAGEFKDFCEETFMDRVKDRFTKRR